MRSAFALPAEQQAAIQKALNETFSADVKLRFETAPDLVSGIELTANGQKVAWSIADYLASLENGIDELLKEKDRPKAKTEARAKPETKVEPDPETKSASKPEDKLEGKPAAKAEPEPKAKTEPKPEVKAMPNDAKLAEKSK